LIDRLSNRLGARNVVRLTSVDSHLPERAVSYAPALSEEKEIARSSQRVNLQRPLHLLPRPEVISVMAEVPDGPPLRFKWRRVSYRAVKASGPERIEDEWWRGALRPARDYYRIETPEGWRFWMFRAGLYGQSDAAPQWYVHGFFA
jgi:protein ImuB